VILVDEINEIPEPKVTLKPFAAADAVPAAGEQETMAEEPAVTPPAQKDDTPGTAKSNRGRKSIREMSRDAALVEIPPDEQLFSKQYYGIGEVATMFNVNASLLRFWESEFDILKPRKNKKGDRFFRPEDIKNIQQIHHLLRERKYTIEGAREFLKKSGRRQQQFEAIESLKKIRTFLLELKAGL
jgi:DNA-binding transcriptional MerR regulator